MLRSLWSGGLFYTYTTTKTPRWSCRCFHLVLALESLMPGPPQWHILSPGRCDNNALKQKSKRHQIFWWLVTRFIGSSTRGNALVSNSASHRDACGMRLLLLIWSDKGGSGWPLHCFYVVSNNAFDFFHLSEDSAISIK